MNTLLTPEEMGDAICLDIERQYPTSGYGSVYTFDVEGLCKAQDAKTRKAIIEWLREHNKVSETRCYPRELLLYREDWQALQEGKVP